MAKSNALNVDLSDCTGISLAGSQVTGNLDKTHFAGGVGANSGTYFCGDNTWKAIGSTGTVDGTAYTGAIPYYPDPGTNAVVGPMTASSERGVLICDSSGIPQWLGTKGNGLLPIGSSSGSPAANTVTNGERMAFGYDDPNITVTIQNTQSNAFNVTATSASMIHFGTYIANNAGLVTLTLPSTARAGSIIRVLGLGAGGWKIAQNAGQSIMVGGVESTVGAVGSVESANRYDSMKIICISADTKWSVLGNPLSSGLIIT